MVAGGCGQVHECIITHRTAYIVVAAGHDPRGFLLNDVTD